VGFPGSTNIGPVMVHVIVEVLLETPLSDAEHARLGKAVDECVGARGGRWMRSYLSADHLRMVCEFEAGDAESIREAYRSAGAPFVRVWSAERYERYPTPPGESMPPE
jgi:hypothetical protein